MENTEIMNYEDEMNDVEIVEMESENSGIGTAVAMAIGAGLTVAVGAAIKLGKKLWAKHKAKKEVHLVDEKDFVEVSDEQVEEVTK